MEIIHVDGVGHSLPAIVLAEVTGDIVDEFLGNWNHQIGILVGIS